MATPAAIDPIAIIPEPDALRRLISEQVARTHILRRLLRLALEREQRLKRTVSAATCGEVANASQR